MTDETRTELQRRLSDLEAFMATAVYNQLQKTIDEDISAVGSSILATPPKNIETLFENLRLYGRLEELQRSKTLFEDARETLKDHVEEKLDVEQNVTTTKTENEDLPDF